MSLPAYACDMTYGMRWFWPRTVPGSVQNQMRFVSFSLDIHTLVGKFLFMFSGFLHCVCAHVYIFHWNTFFKMDGNDLIFFGKCNSGRNSRCQKWGARDLCFCSNFNSNRRFICTKDFCMSTWISAVEHRLSSVSTHLFSTPNKYFTLTGLALINLDLSTLKSPPALYTTQHTFETATAHDSISTKLCWPKTKCQVWVCHWLKFQFS